MAVAKTSATFIVPKRCSWMRYPPMLPGTMPAFMPAFSVSGVMSAGTMPFGAAPAIESDHTLPVPLW